jgi:hypothetical protein
MWVWLDRAGLILFDAALSTGLFLSVVVCAMLLCRQPSRRLLIVRSSLLGALVILPLVAASPLPRINVLALIIQADLLPPASTIRDVSAHSPPRAVQQGPVDRLHSFITIFKGDYAAWAGRWLPRISQAWAEKHARPNVRVSSAIQRPSLVGLRRMTILIPASFEEPEASKEICKLSLLHELAHAARSDAWFGTVASLAQSIWFFLPHVWWLRSQLMIDQEFIADHAASQGYGTSKDYAASLLSLADSRPVAGALPLPLSPVRSLSTNPKRRMHSPLFQRMLMLLHCPFPVERNLPRLWSWSLRCMLLAALLASACVCIRWPHAQAIETARPGPVKGAREPFRVAEFVAAPIVRTPGGRGLPRHMPVELATRFDLRVEVLSSPDALGKIRVAGHPLLGDSSSSKRVVDSLANPSRLAESWHRIRLRRVGLDLALWIDGRKSSVPLDPKATTEWLTFDPGPDRLVSFRDLVIDW